MKILVCIKEVPSRDSRLETSASGTWVEERALSYEASECDEFALEEALRLKEKLGGEVVVLSVGTARTEKVLRKALAMGADRAVLVVDEQHRLNGPAAVAGALAAVAKQEGFDLVLAGTQSDDTGYSQTGVMLAEKLGILHATLVMQIVPEPPASLKVLREMESGTFQWVRLGLPALLAIQAGSSPVRFVALTGIMKAKSKPVRLVPQEELGISDEVCSHQIIERLYQPESGSKGVLIEGKEPVDAVKLLVEMLRNEAKVL